MNDESVHEYINLVLSSAEDNSEALSYTITRKFGFYSAQDGILYSDLCEFLTNEDFLKAAESYSKIKDYNEFYITGTSTLYFNFKDKYNIGFSNQHLFSDGSFRKVWNNDGMNGKYYEIVIGTINAETGTSNTCFGVYIPR